MSDDVTGFFWETAAPLLAEPNVARATMMGFPCLRVDGAFFASCDHRTGDLIVKLPAERVAELIVSGEGKPFAPAGRRFREWATVSERDSVRWNELLDEARRFVSGLKRP
jgi:hypothetical protein